MGRPVKIYSIVGARPQFIKLAALSPLLSEKYNEVIVHTGQHYNYEMDKKIFRDLGLRNPDVVLKCGSGSHAVQTSVMMCALEFNMIKDKPDMVIVFGDTNTTLAGALTAAKLNIPLIHIEAGIRGFNKALPEEINRVVTDHVSTFLFAPTQGAMRNLDNEGLASISYLTGDLMADALIKYIGIAEKKSKILDKWLLKKKKYYLLTLHRGYNVDDPNTLKNILNKLDEIGELIIFPIHPRTVKSFNKIELVWKNILTINPVGYLDFIMLQKNAEKIITDSGGVQKEAYLLKKPCITLRTETEWEETVGHGWNLLIHSGHKVLAKSIKKFVPSRDYVDLYESGAALKMMSLIEKIV